MLTMRRVAVLGVLGVLASCGGLDVDEYAGQLAAARCGYQVRCGLFATLDDCLAEAARTAIDNPNPKAAVDAGKIAFSEDAAQACLDAYAALSCDTTMQTSALDVCADVFTGTVPIGETCAFDGECESDSCVVPSCTGVCCQGTCAPARTPPAIGEPCTFLCADGAYCTIEGTCAALLPAGAACSDPLACAVGLYCAGYSAMTSGSCRAIPHLGEPCESFCAEAGAICDSGTCVEAGVRGDACTSSAQCSVYYECIDGACATFPALGMPCTSRCADGAWCNSGTCEAQKPLSADCLRNDECQTHFCLRNGAVGACSDVPLCI